MELHTCPYSHLHHSPLHKHDHHTHDTHSHTHDHTHAHTSDKKLLAVAFCITFAVMFLEIIGGIYANSLALISDAVHMFTHAFALALSLFAIFIAHKARNDAKSFGYFRAEVLAAFVNGITIALSVLWIVYEAAIRFIHPEAILSTATFVVALVGLITNLLTGYILYKADMENLNIRSAFLHMLADAFSSIAVILGAVAIYYTQLYIIDTLLALMVAGIIAKWSFSLIKDSVHILLEGSPVDTTKLKEEILSSFKNVKDVHDIHCWEITANYYYFTAHIAVEKLDEESYNATIRGISEFLEHNYGIGHVTLQIERAL